MSFEERALTFTCRDAQLCGIASIPARPAARGLLILVGGPQYRAGSHRQFTLLARELAAGGIPVFRFDYRGMGDSEGDARNFENIDDDIRAAIDTFMAEVPSLGEVAIWGLCDAASAALFYASHDRRVTGLALLNPWMRTESGIAKTYLRHYYLRRLSSLDFWKRAGRGEIDYARACRSLMAQLKSAFFQRRSAHAQMAQRALTPLPERMRESFASFSGRVLLILSEQDLTAQEFEGVANASSRWRKLLADRRVRRHTLAGANHTFSRREWRDSVAAWTREWLISW